MERRPWAVLAMVWLLMAVPLGGCRALRLGADLGHRVIDRDGLPPAKLFGYFGASAGYTIGLPIAIVLLPTYACPRLYYLSSPEHDLQVPLVLSPLEVGGGFGAFVASVPFFPFRPWEKR